MTLRSAGSSPGYRSIYVCVWELGERAWNGDDGPNWAPQRPRDEWRSRGWVGGVVGLEPGGKEDEEGS